MRLRNRRRTQVRTDASLCLRREGATVQEKSRTTATVGTVRCQRVREDGRRETIEDTGHDIRLATDVDLYRIAQTGTDWCRAPNVRRIPVRSSSRHGT